MFKSFRILCFLLTIIWLQPFTNKSLAQSGIGNQPRSKTNTIHLPKLVPYRQGELWGFADSTGKIKVQPQYIQAKPLENGLAQVFSVSGTGLINEQGKEVISPVYTNIIFFHIGIRIDSKEGKYGVANLNGKQALPVIYDYIHFLDLPDISQHLVRAGYKSPQQVGQKGSQRKTTVGLFSLEGKQILPIAYSEINYKKEGIIEACKTDTCQYFTFEGKEFLPPAKQRLSDFKKGVASICDETGCGYLNRNGQICVPKQFKAANNFSEGLAAVSTKDGKWGYINKEGKLVSAAIFEANDELKYLEQFDKLNSGSNNSVAGELKNGLALVRQKEKVGFMGRDGKLLTPVEYDKIERSNFPGKYYLLKGNKSVLGHLDSLSGKFIIEENPGWFISPFSEGLSAIRQGKLLGYIDENLKLVIPYLFVEGSMFKDGIAIVAKPVAIGMRYGIIDKKNRVVLPFEYGRIEPVGKDLFRVYEIFDGKSTERCGLFNAETKLLTALKYTSIGEFKDGVAPFMIGEAFGFLNQKGQEVFAPIQIPNEYSACGELKNGIIKICHKQSKKEGYMDIYGRTYFAD